MLFQFLFFVPENRKADENDENDENRNENLLLVMFVVPVNNNRYLMLRDTNCSAVKSTTINFNQYYRIFSFSFHCRFHHISLFGCYNILHIDEQSFSWIKRIAKIHIMIIKGTKANIEQNKINDDDRRLVLNISSNTQIHHRNRTSLLWNRTSTYFSSFFLFRPRIF